VVDVQEISPIDNAITEVRQRTAELNILYTRYSALAKTSQTVSTNALSMTLNSAVDAPVNGGIALFRQQYLGSEYTTRYPDRAERVEKLRQTVDDQVRAFFLLDHIGLRDIRTRFASSTIASSSTVDYVRQKCSPSTIL
jgi:dedicator of cytokinesis protein 3